jgi:ectoine hydroxylase-related dioxygenase (phytanoyl-CoA dioxygenase family)
MRKTRASYRIWKRALTITAEDIQRQRTYLDARAYVVFNPDEKRFQAKIPMTDPLIAQLVSRMRSMLGEHEVQEPVVLQSLAGCLQQEWHTDYDEDNRSGFSLLIALQDDTRLETPGKTIELERGDLLVFRSDLVHAGSSYDRENLRIFLFCDLPTVKRRRNATYIRQWTNGS